MEIEKALIGLDHGISMDIDSLSKKTGERRRSLLSFISGQIAALEYLANYASELQKEDILSDVERLRKQLNEVPMVGR